MENILTVAEPIEYQIKGDFLNRQEFIQKIKSVIELLSDKKKNSCFAISGSWGIGKSYVIDQVECTVLNDVRQVGCRHDKQRERYLVPLDTTFQIGIDVTP